MQPTTATNPHTAAPMETHHRQPITRPHRPTGHHITATTQPHTNGAHLKEFNLHFAHLINEATKTKETRRPLANSQSGGHITATNQRPNQRRTSDREQPRRWIHTRHTGHGDHITQARTRHETTRRPPTSGHHTDTQPHHHEPATATAGRQSERRQSLKIVYQKSK